MPSPSTSPRPSTPPPARHPPSSAVQHEAPSTPAAVAGPGAAVERLVEVVDLLRRHCRWTAALTHEALLAYLVEETYELYEAVDDVARASVPSPGLVDELRGELGDVLFQVVLHARLAAEQDRFDLADVVAGLTAKLVRRNPHVFAADGALLELPGVAAGPGGAAGAPASADEIVETWHAVKRRENPSRTSPFDGIPHHLPALAFAAKTLARAGESPGRSEGGPESGTAGTQQEFPPGDESGLGQALLELTRRAVHLGVDPERALRRAVLEYQADSERA